MTKKYKGLSYRQKRLIKAVFAFENFILLIGIVFFLYAYVGLVTKDDYPNINSLTYEECTFIEYEYIEYRYSKYGKTKYYNIYVEEYDKPLKTDDLVYKCINKDVLDELDSGDTVKVSLSKEENKIEIYAMFFGGDSVLTYDDYLTEHKKDEAVGYVFLPVILCACFFGFFVGVKKKMNS